MSAAIPNMLPEELLTLILEQFAIPAYFSDWRELIKLRDDSKQGGGDDNYQKRIVEGLSTLQNVCLVSKSMHRLAWPILYRGFLSHELPSRIFASVPLQLKTPPFLQTLCIKPEYGLALRSLSIGKWQPMHHMGKTKLIDSLPENAIIAALFQWKAKGFWFGGSGKRRTSPADLFESALLRGLGMGAPDAYLAMLLLVCPNIQELDISPPLNDFDDSMIMSLLDTLLAPELKNEPVPLAHSRQEETDYITAQMSGAPWPRQNLQKPAVLQSLRRLKIHCWGFRTPEISIHAFSKFITLPSLHTLSVDRVQGLCLSNPESTFGWGAKNDQLRVLELISCKILTEELMAIVECCPTLSELTASWSSPETDSAAIEAPRFIRYGQLAATMAHSMPSLKKLSLDATNWPYFGPSSEAPFTVGNSFQGLGELQTLRIDYNAVFGYHHPNPNLKLAELVPASLRRLYIGPPALFGHVQIQWWPKHQVDELSRFLENHASKNLVEVEVDAGYAAIALEEEVHGWDVFNADGLWRFSRIPDDIDGK